MFCMHTVLLFNNGKVMLNSNQTRAVLAWALLFLVIFYNFRRNPESILLDSPFEHERRRALTSIDAIVYIAMSTLAADRMIDLSIDSVRHVGKYRGDIYVITDRPDCFRDSRKLQVITTKVHDNIMHIKSLKSKLFSLLPAHVVTVLYMDVDILVSRELKPFFRDSAVALSTWIPNSLPSAPTSSKGAPSTSTSTASGVAPGRTSHAAYDMGVFEDAKGHYLGFCSGCEKWHTGVLWLHRNHGSKCLEAWGDIIMSGKFPTDQQSLDEAERLGNCTRLVSLPARHLLFAKDYIAWILSQGNTFIHITAGSRLDTQDYFYREFVVSKLWKSNGKGNLLAGPKECLASTTTALAVSSPPLSAQPLKIEPKVL